MKTISSAILNAREAENERLRRMLDRASLEFDRLETAKSHAEREARLSAIWADDLELVAEIADDPWKFIAAAELQRRRLEWACATCNGSGRFDDIECPACKGTGEKGE